jgi:lysozyme
MMKRAIRILPAAILLIASGTGFAQTGEFDEPWKDARVAIVLDPYEGNSIVWEELAKDPRVVGIIHRVTIGDRVDAKYAERKEVAKGRGYKWGSYHLGKPGDPVRQADFYLDAVKPADDEVMALDIESLDASKDMTLTDARRFIQRIREKTGRYPVLYANHAVVKAISDRYPKDAVFSKTPLWYARFKSRVTDFPVKTWDTYTLWQFSSEINCTASHPEHCLYRAPGTKTDMDVNVYRGTVDELKANWPFGKE